MAFESINYLFVVPLHTDPAQVQRTLQEAGAVQAESGGWVLAAERSHWIDILVRPTPPSIAIRMALTNPEHAFDVLWSLLLRLWRDIGGALYTPDDDTRFELADDETRRTLLADYRFRRHRFRMLFGDLEAAVSADDVYRLLDGDP